MIIDIVTRGSLSIVTLGGEGAWQLAERVFGELIRSGANIVVLVATGF